MHHICASTTCLNSAVTCHLIVAIGVVIALRGVSMARAIIAGQEGAVLLFLALSPLWSHYMVVALAAITITVAQLYRSGCIVVPAA